MIKSIKLFYMIANTPAPPYYAVIFTSIRTNIDEASYADTAEKMVALAAKQPGFLGVESANDGLGITVSYWDGPESIRNWKLNAEHLLAQQMGREVFYKSYKTRIARVEREYGFEK
jgi:heme-degrading monooxygenase HmoA